MFPPADTARLGGRVRRVAGGGVTALVPAVDRVTEPGRDGQAGRPKRLVTG